MTKSLVTLTLPTMTVNKVTQVVNNLAPYKTIRVKNRYKEWLDGELAQQISNRDKLLKSSKKANFTLTS